MPPSNCAKITELQGDTFPLQAAPQFLLVLISQEVDIQAGVKIGKHGAFHPSNGTVRRERSICLHLCETYFLLAPRLKQHMSPPAELQKVVPS